MGRSADGSSLTAAILPTSEPGRFAVWFVKDEQRVTFAVTAPAEPGGAWTVAEVARAPYDGPPEPEPVEVLPIELEHLGGIDLAVSEPPAGPIRDVSGFDLDDRGRIGVPQLLESRHPRAAGYVSPRGAERRRRRGAVRPSARTGGGRRGGEGVRVAWVGGDAWVVTDSPDDRDAAARAWVIDAAKESVRKLDRFDAPAVTALDGTGDGGFAAPDPQGPGVRRAPRGSPRFDADGGRAVAREGGVRGPARPVLAERPWPSPTTGGSRWSAPSPTTCGCSTGTADTWRRCRSNGCSAANRATPTGWVPTGTAGSSRTFTASRRSCSSVPTGSSAAGFQPRFPDGRSVPFGGLVRSAADGRIWTSDGVSLLRLDEKGVVDRVLGDPPDPARVGRGRGRRGGRRGEDSRRRRPHRGGARLLAGGGNGCGCSCRTPDDFNGPLGIARGHDRSRRRRVREGFARGRIPALPTRPAPVSAGWRTAPVNDGPPGRWQFRPDGGRWVMGYDTVSLVAADGTVRRTIARTPEDPLARPARRPSPSGRAGRWR